MTDLMDNLVEHVLDELPMASRPIVRQLYQRLSPAQKSAAEDFVSQAQRHLGLKETKRLLHLVREQYAPAFAGPQRVCIAGPVNSGKSSLYNALLTEKGNQASVSPIPGTTKDTQAGQAGVLTIVDTPGADDVEIGLEGEQAGERRRKIAMHAASDADMLLLVFDASTGISRGALAVYHDLTGLNKPFVVALNKIDLVKRQQDEIVALAARTLGLETDQVIPTSATQGTNLERLVLALVRESPELLATLGMALPAFRATLAAEQIRTAAGAAGTINLVTSPIPVPFASFVPLTAVQAGLVLSLARLYGHQLTLERSRELVVTFGMGFGARTLFQQFVTKIPGPGWILGTALAMATTLAIGYSAQVWFARGERLTTESMRLMLDRTVSALVERLKALGTRRPSQEQLDAGIEQTLREILIAEPTERNIPLAGSPPGDDLTRGGTLPLREGSE